MVYECLRFILIFKENSEFYDKNVELEIIYKMKIAGGID